jgi:spore germination protein YaaH
MVTHIHLCGTGSPASPGASTMRALRTRAASMAKGPDSRCRQMVRLVVLTSVLACLVLLSGDLRCRAASRELEGLPTTPQAEPADGKPLAIGFYVDWDLNGYLSLRNYIQSLDWVVPSWMYMWGESMDLRTSVNLEVLDLIRTEKPKTRILAMIQNANAGQWDGINLSRFLADPTLRRERIKEIASFIETYSLQGIVIDLEQIQDSAQKDMITFVSEVHATFKEKGWIVSVAVPFDDPNFDYARYAKACDYLILMGYDEHWSTGDPGPIASYHWFSTRFATRMRGVAPSQTIIAIGNYGYDWTRGVKEAQVLTFPEVMQRARKMNATVELDPASLNPRYSYRSEGKAHQVWFLNSASAYYQLQAADSYRPAGYALWRLGGEDPAIWSVLPHAYHALPTLSSVKQAKDLKLKAPVD